MGKSKVIPKTTMNKKSVNAKIITEGHSVEQTELKVQEFMFTRLKWQVEHV